LDINQRSIAFDVLIALAAWRVKATVVTEDGHFEILKEKLSS
jgi:predicted nucleic acid-binding protein